MANWALIIDGSVWETTTESPEGRFSEDMHWESCSAAVSQGWSFSGGKFAAPTFTIDDAKAARISGLTNACAAAIVGGYSSTALGSPHTYPSGVTDQINMMGSVTASLLPALDAGWKTPFWCCNEGGVWAFRDHSQSQIQIAGSDGKAHVVTCQGTLAQLSAAAIAAVTESDIEAIVWPTE